MPTRRRPEPSLFTAAQRRELRAALERERRRLLALYENDVEHERELVDGDPRDSLDEAEATVEREDLFALTEAERERILLIEEALARLDDGSYGRCLFSGAPIELERLRAVPWARYRAEVQERIEQGLLDERRPQTWPTSRD